MCFFFLNFFQRILRDQFAEFFHVRERFCFLSAMGKLQIIFQRNPGFNIGFVVLDQAHFHDLQKIRLKKLSQTKYAINVILQECSATLSRLPPEI